MSESIDSSSVIKVRRRILVSAYGCEPGKGSEQGVGWNWVKQLSTFSDVVVITRNNNEIAINEVLDPVMKKRVSFIFYDPPASIRRLKRKEKGLYLYYLIWQLGAYRLARKIVRDGHFDYVIHLTFGSIWMPTFMHRLSVPFIWGPVGGGEAVPFRLISALPFSGRAVQYFRYALMATFSVNPIVMDIVKRSEIILARTGDTARLIPASYSRKVRVVLETAISEDLLSEQVRNQPKVEAGPLRVVFTGRLVAFKNVAAAISAVALAAQRGLRLNLVIVGDGPLRKELENLTRSLGIESLVDFRGAVPQVEVISELHKSDVYLFPSLREGGVWSLMEAMSVGLPVICVKTSGMELITDDASAIRIEPVSQEIMVDGFAQALLGLGNSPEWRRQLGENARNRIEENFRWQHKAEFMQTLLSEIDGNPPINN